jgi:hypothetical protein
MTVTYTTAAAFKAHNLAQPVETIIITADRKPTRKSQRQEWQEFRAETLGMIEAAKRERHFHILSQLMQRLNTANTMLANHAIQLIRNRGRKPPAFLLRKRPF